MWFAALGSYQSSPWFVHLANKLLEGSPSVKALLDERRDPFPDKPPEFIRAHLYHYDFTNFTSDSGAWWRRTFIQEYLPALERNNPSVKKFLAAYGWNDDEVGNNCFCNEEEKTGFQNLQCGFCQRLQIVHDTNNIVVVTAGVIATIMFVGLLKIACCRRLFTTQDKVLPPLRKYKCD